MQSPWEKTCCWEVVWELRERRQGSESWMGALLGPGLLKREHILAQGRQSEPKVLSKCCPGFISLAVGSEQQELEDEAVNDRLGGTWAWKASLSC